MQLMVTLQPCLRVDVVPLVLLALQVERTDRQRTASFAINPTEFGMGSALNEALEVNFISVQRSYN